nr:MAG TPA: hypothetical protein [Caudoviricetes sp.]
MVSGHRFSVSHQPSVKNSSKKEMKLRENK